MLHRAIHPVCHPLAINEGAVPENGMPGIQYAYGRVVNDDRPRHQGLGLNTGKPGGGGQQNCKQCLGLKHRRICFLLPQSITHHSCCGWRIVNWQGYTLPALGNGSMLEYLLSGEHRQVTDDHQDCSWSNQRRIVGSTQCRWTCGRVRQERWWKTGAQSALK